LFINEFFDDDYYEACPNEPAFGRIYRTACYYPHENLEFFRPIPTPEEAAISQASRFIIRSAGGDRFSHGFPLAVPKLESNEEFIVVRAKPRPVVLLVPQQPIEGVTTSGYGGKIWRKRCLVGQVFGLQDTASGKQEFNPDFVDRIKLLEFPQLMFLPKQAGVLTVDSVLRLDECQSVFTPHLEHSGYGLTEHVRNLLRSQLQCLLTGEYSGDFADYREELLKK
jgi:hypothetical protein